MKKKVKETIYKNIKVIVAFVIVSILLLSLAYANSSAAARVENILVSVKPHGNVTITGLSLNSSSNGGTSSNEEYNVSSIFSSISLPNADSTVTYKVDATVFSATEMKLSSITGLNSHLEYSISNYTLGESLCNTNDECNYGATDELLITIGYKSGEYDSSNTNYALSMNFVFEKVTYIAKIGNTRYITLSAAVSAVPKNDTETTVMLLDNTSEIITVAAHQNIKFDLQSFTISNSGKNPVITNNGVIKIYNGTITSDTSQGAINNNGTLNMTGGRIVATGTRQAIYNAGTVNISGDAYLSAVTVERAPLQNLATGTVNITGGTIISTAYYGIENLGTLTIGTKDGNVSSSSPLIKGETYGVYTTPDFSFYDGVIEGKTDAVNDENLIDDIETGTEILHAMDGLYKKISLGLKITITFNPNGGSVTEASREIAKGGVIGTLPTPTRSGFDCVGWFTDPNAGTEITASTTFNNDDEIYAHWEVHYHYVADINGTKYSTLQDAVDDVATDNVKVTITILDDINNENITISSGKNIELDIGSYTISNETGIIFDNSGTLEIKNGKILRNGTNDQNRVIQNERTGHLIISGGDIKSNIFQVIRNYGTLTITGGKIWAATIVDQGIINNENNATMTISGGEVIGTKRQAIYNDGGRLTISGNPSLTNGSGTTPTRACVQNHKGTTTISGGSITTPASSYPAVLNESTMTITGGTITAPSQNGVNNTSSLTIGIKDGTIDTIVPSITAGGYGVNSTGTFKFYDGTIRGVTGSINGTVTEIETGSTRVDATEVINNTTYNTTHLE